MSTEFWKILLLNLKNLAMGAELFQAEERTYGENFAKAVKNPFKRKCLCIRSIFLICHVFNSFVIWNNISFLCFLCYNFFLFFLFAELGGLYRYESSSPNLLIQYLWPATDLLVWISANQTGKTKCLIIIFDGLVSTLYS